MGRYYMSGEKRCELSDHSEDGGSNSNGDGEKWEDIMCMLEINLKVLSDGLVLGKEKMA